MRISLAQRETHVRKHSPTLWEWRPRLQSYARRCDLDSLSASFHCVCPMNGIFDATIPSPTFLVLHRCIKFLLCCCCFSQCFKFLDVCARMPRVAYVSIIFTCVITFASGCIHRELSAPPASHYEGGDGLRPGRDTLPHRHCPLVVAAVRGRLR